MLTLSILRHAKASRDDPMVEDFDRPLAPRGEKDASAMGVWMVKHGLSPDLVLASTSERTRATCTLAFKSFVAEPPITFDDDLYLANPRTLLGIVRHVGDDIRHLMLVGHNPGLHALATAFVATGPADLRALLDDKLPTSGLVVLAFDAARFADVKPGTGRLNHFVGPKNLGT